MDYPSVLMIPGVFPCPPPQGLDLWQTHALTTDGKVGGSGEHRASGGRGGRGGAGITTLGAESKAVLAIVSLSTNTCEAESCASFPTLS